MCVLETKWNESLHEEHSERQSCWAGYHSKLCILVVYIIKRRGTWPDGAPQAPFALPVGAPRVILKKKFISQSIGSSRQCIGFFSRGQSSQSEWTCPRRLGGHCPAAKTSLCFKPPLFSSMGSASLKWERENIQEQLPLPTEQQLLCVQCTQLCRTWQTFIFVATVVITGSAVGRPSI